MIRLAAIGITLVQSLGEILANRPPKTSVGVTPRKTIVFPRGTNNSLRELVHLSAIMLFQRVFALGLDVATANLDGIKLVAANAPEKNFLSAGLGVE